MKNTKVLIIIMITIINFTNAKLLEFPKIPGLENFRAIPSNPRLRRSSYPYISGDTFRSFCDFIIDKTNRFINPNKIKNGDTIFIASHTEFLDFFFKHVHPKIKSKYILVTHNSDKSNYQSYSKYLDDNNLIAWFGQNLTLEHKKTFPIPIGLPNKYWKYGNTKAIENISKNSPLKKDILLYMNFASGTNKQKREPVYDLFSQKTFCYNAKRKPLEAFINEIARSKFVLSPEGNGIDCVRTWEALYLGAIPIVTHSRIDSVFQNLPVIIINDWNKITEEYLVKKYAKMSNKTYNLEKTFADYWFKEISKLKEKAKTI